MQATGGTVRCATALLSSASSGTADSRTSGWLTSRTEYDYTADPATETLVEFEYDNRGRLVRETRTIAGNPGETVYDITYTYDLLGNRKTQEESVSGRSWLYTYDTDLDPEDPPAGWTHVTCNIRLLHYVECDEAISKPGHLLTLYNGAC